MNAGVHGFCHSRLSLRESSVTLGGVFSKRLVERIEGFVLMGIDVSTQPRKTGWKHRRHLRLRLGLCERYVIDLLLAVLKESIEGSATFAERKATMPPWLGAGRWFLLITNLASV